MARRIVFLLSALLLAVFVCAANSHPVYAKSLFSRPFTYFADHQDVGTVLIGFARTQGYSAAFSPHVKGKVSARFNAVEPDEFLKGMQEAFDINWYSLAGTLHFYNAQEKKRIFISPRTGSARELMDALQRASVFSPQLPPTLGAMGDMISVSGPAEYLQQIQSAVASYEASKTEKIVMEVFPLKHAWAENQTVTSMDKTITIPGIASILRAMVMGTSVTSTTVTQQRATVSKLGGTGLAAQGQPPQQVEEKPTSANSPINTGSVSIMADPRVNAVLVSDAAYRMPYYRKVIADLDKPVELVEIHAAIVDVDSNFKRDLGVTFQGGKYNNSGWGVNGSSSGSASLFSPTTTAGIVEQAGATLSTIYTHGTDFFLNRIHVLEENKQARMLGRPSVLTVDNIQATLENTTTYYVQVQGYQAVDLYKVEAGTVLRVTPHIIRTGNETSIKLAVSVQDDQDTASSNTGTSSGVPPIKQTKINTQAIVNEGQSLLIGGYYYEEKGDGDSGVPGLKKIPVLGHLFKTTEKKNRRMERLILITPRIVSLKQGNVPLHVDEPTMHRLATQNHYEEYYPMPQKRPGCSRSSEPEPKVMHQATVVTAGQR